jgi:hypothetical protein
VLINFVKIFDENAEKLKIIEEEFDFVFFSLDKNINLIPNTVNGFLFCKVCFSFFCGGTHMAKKVAKKKAAPKKKAAKKAVKKCSAKKCKK